MNQIEQYASCDAVKILIGNKCDLPDKKIDSSRGKMLAEQYGMTFFETSAKCDINVQESFTYIAKEIKNNQLEAHSKSGKVVPIEKKLQKTSKCYK